MTGLLNSSSILMCPHGWIVQPTSSNTRANAAGDFLLRMSDTFLINASPLALGPVPHSCVQVQWGQPTARNKAAGHFTVTEAGVALCAAAETAPQYTVIITFTQPRVTSQ